MAYILFTYALLLTIFQFLWLSAAVRNFRDVNGNQ